MRASSWYFVILRISAVFLVGGYAGMWRFLWERMKNMRKHKSDLQNSNLHADSDK